MPKFLVTIATSFEAELEFSDADLRDFDIDPQLDSDDLNLAVSDMLVDNWQEFLTLSDEASVPTVTVRRPDSTYLLPSHFREGDSK